MGVVVRSFGRAKCAFAGKHVLMRSAARGEVKGVGSLVGGVDPTSWRQSRATKPRHGRAVCGWLRQSSSLASAKERPASCRIFDSGVHTCVRKCSIAGSSPPKRMRSRSRSTAGRERDSFRRRCSYWSCSAMHCAWLRAHWFRDGLLRCTHRCGAARRGGNRQRADPTPASRADR